MITILASNCLVWPLLIELETLLTTLLSHFIFVPVLLLQGSITVAALMFVTNRPTTRHFSIFRLSVHFLSLLLYFPQLKRNFFTNCFTPVTTAEVINCWEHRGLKTVLQEEAGDVGCASVGARLKMLLLSAAVIGQF